jgi:hypothetical protein
MATKKITDLVELISAASGDVLPIVDISDDITKKIQVNNLLASKQDTLVSGTNIKTINSTSLLGSGDVAVQETLVSGTNIKTLNSESLLGSGNIEITASPAGVIGAIQFSDGSAFASDAANLFWDDTNKRLGVGTNAPTTDLQVAALNPIISTRVTSNGTGKFAFLGSGANEFGSIQLSAASGEMRMFTNTTYFPTFYSSGAEAMRISTARNLGIGLTNPTARTHIKGSGSTSATTSLLVQNSAGVDMMKITDDITTTIGNQFNIIRTTVPTQLIEINAHFGTLAPVIRAGGNGKDFILSAKDSRDLYLSTNFATNTTQVQFAVKHNIGVLIKDNASTAMDASARLEVASTTQGFLPPRMTTTQKNAISSPASGLMVYDTDTNKLCCYNGTSWNDLF